MLALKRILLLVLGMAGLLLLSSCVPRQELIPAPITVPYHPLTNAQNTEIALLRRTGVVFFKHGDVVWMSIPTDRYFRPGSTKLRSYRVKDVKRIARFVRGYTRGFRRPKVSVMGYTDKVYSVKKRKHLSEQYAKVISSYLWSYGVSAHVMHIKGYGAAHSVASNLMPAGSYHNRRVVIRIQ